MTRRMNAADRREQLLAAASRAFAQGGYAGTSTDTIAREAGVSQPYVVRTFGSKALLFQDVIVRAQAAVIQTFTRELDGLDGSGLDPQGEEFWDRLGDAYAELVGDRVLLLVLMQGFVAGGDVEIGVRARSCMAEIYELLRTRTGCAPDQARQFIAEGMLLNALLAMRAPEHSADEPALEELSVCAFGTDFVRASVEQASPN